MIYYNAIYNYTCGSGSTSWHSRAVVLVTLITFFLGLSISIKSWYHYYCLYYLGNNCCFHSLLKLFINNELELTLLHNFHCWLWIILWNNNVKYNIHCGCTTPYWLCLLLCFNYFNKFNCLYTCLCFFPFRWLDGLNMYTTKISSTEILNRTISWWGLVDIVTRYVWLQVTCGIVYLHSCGLIREYLFTIEAVYMSDHCIINLHLTFSIFPRPN